MNMADTAFILIATALVMLMTPGLAFFYGGLVRRKNVLSVLMQCFIALGALTLHWFFFGYSLSFAPGGGFWGGLDWAFLKGVGLEPMKDYAPTIPHQAFMVFQAMFAVITPALIIGAFAERMKFAAFLVFSLLWATFVYDPVCHWVWGVGGFLRDSGALDFAGGLVVHTTAGTAALAAALVIGKRKGFGKKAIPPHSLPLAVLGAGLLWFGWFGFNAGSALAANNVAVSAFLATHAAAAAGGLAWALIEWIKIGRPTVFGVITGAVAGLATVTPAAGFIGPMPAVLIGLVAAALCYWFVAVLKNRFGYDDSLDAFGVHGVGGMLGTLLVGVFASKLINPGGADGLLAGNPGLLWTQFKAIAIVGAYSFVVSWALFKLVDKFIGIRVSEKSEDTGLDLTEHRESGYTVLE